MHMKVYTVHTYIKKQLLTYLPVCLFRLISVIAGLILKRLSLVADLDESKLLLISRRN